MDTLNIISDYIAPWALPFEDIPIHLMWEPSFQYDFIEVQLPLDMEIKEFYNVDTFQQKDSIYIISGLKTPNFFGLSIATKNIIKSQHITEQVKVNFFKNSEKVYTKIFTANIFRPFLSLMESPKTIILNDDQSKKNSLDVKLKLSGFGKIQMNLDINTGGEFIESAEPLYQEIVRRIISSFKIEDFDVKDKGIKIDPRFLERKAKEYLEMINNGIVPPDLNKENLQDFQLWVGEEKNRDKLTSLISKHVENLLVDSLIYYFDKYPTEDVKLSQGKPVMYIEKATHKVKIRFRYNDDLNNEYDPILLSTDVDDQRSDKEISIEFPINITWSYDIINPLDTCKQEMKYDE